MTKRKTGRGMLVENLCDDKVDHDVVSDGDEVKIAA
jgi:hypothetical protein